MLGFYYSYYLDNLQKSLKMLYLSYKYKKADKLPKINGVMETFV